MKKRRKMGITIMSLLLLSAITVNLAGCIAMPIESESLAVSSSEPDITEAKEDMSKQEETSEPTQSGETEESSNRQEPDVLELAAVDLMAGVASNAVTPADDLNAGNAAVTDFAIRLFNAANENGKSTLISPLSVLYALAMTANGAEGETKAEIEETIGMSVYEMNLYLFSYMQSLYQGKHCRLSLANSIWFTSDDRFSVNQSFLQKNADYYGADVYKAPFDDQTLADINNWVSYRTEGLINKALDEIPENAIMYLINTLLFDAEWAHIYSEYSVFDGKFTTEDGRKIDVRMMSSEENKYLEDENTTGFIKYYNGGKYAFAAMLPKEGLSVAEYLESLDGATVRSLLAGAKNVDVNTVMPKFTTEYNTQMSRVLENMGIVSAFSGGKADFSGLGKSNAGNIYISRVIHKTFIEVGEKGTKAGAVTIIEAADECEPMEPPKNVVLDRPFVYMIIDCENNIPIFIGTMME